MLGSQKIILCACIALACLSVAGGCADSAPKPDAPGTSAATGKPKATATVPPNVQVGPPK